jgi:hypothetical protein
VTLDEDIAELLLELVLKLDFAELLDLVLELDFAELLLDTLVSLSLDFGVTLDEDSSSQSSHTLDDESSEGRVAKSLSSSPQATNIAAQTRIPNQRERIFPPIICIKYKKAPSQGRGEICMDPIALRAPG